MLIDTTGGLVDPAPCRLIGLHAGPDRPKFRAVVAVAGGEQYARVFPPLQAGVDPLSSFLWQTN
jgi:hypothetical protein